MTDLLLVIIILILLFQTHAKEKNAGKYGRLCVFLEKRLLRYLIERRSLLVNRTYHLIKRIIKKIREVKHGIRIK